MFRDEQLYRMKIDEMIKVYREVAPYCMLQSEAAEKVVKHKASSFFIQPHSAYCVLRKVFYGQSDVIPIRTPNTRRLYEEIYRRLLRMSQEPQYVGMSLMELCEIVVNQEAPEFYLSPDTFRGVLLRERAKLRKGGRNAYR